MDNYTKVAIAYDFDGTLAKGNIQEYSFIPELGMSIEDFWNEVNAFTKLNKMDSALSMMYNVIKKSKENPNITITRSNLAKHGKNVEYYSGVESYFERINQYALEHQVQLEHYIISSGTKEMLEGTSIAKYFKAIYASSFIFDSNGEAVWPAIGVNYTMKTQFLSRINKGILNAWESEEVNEFIPQNERPIPYTNIIYIGDGFTDIPAMKAVKSRGGTAIAVYENSEEQQKKSRKLLLEERVNYIAEANYIKDSALDQIITRTIDKIQATASIAQFSKYSIFPTSLDMDKLNKK